MAHEVKKVHGESTKGIDLTFDAEERKGLTHERVLEIRKTSGYNELPQVHVSLLWLFVSQFMGTMPYMYV